MRQDPDRTPLVADTPPGEDVPIIALVNAALRHVKALVGIPLLFFAVVVLVGLFSPRFHTAESRFLADLGDRRAAQLPALAAQLGMEVGGSGESLDFYERLLTSRDLLARAATTEYEFTRGGESFRGTLVELYGAAEDTEEKRLKAAIEQLQEDVATRSDHRAGLVTLTVRAQAPELAVQLNRRLLDLVNEFNVERRQSRARAEREFVQGRMETLEAELNVAEAELERFITQNRRFETSPLLRIEAERRQRRVELLQRVYGGLVESFERARAAEVRDIPVITVVEAPEGSVRPAGRGLFFKGLVALVLGGMVGLAVAFGSEFVARQRRLNPEEFAEFDVLWCRVLRRIMPGGPRRGRPAIGAGAGAPATAEFGGRQVEHESRRLEPAGIASGDDMGDDGR